MLDAFLLACRDALAPQQRRALLLSIALAVLAFLVLWLAITALLHEERLFGNAWLDTTLEILGSLAVLAMSWLFFPVMVTLVLGFFLEGIIAAVERRHYPMLPLARGISFAEVAGSGLRLALLAVIINLAMLPFYLWPGINLFIYYGLNGYLLGRGYFELVALRRLDGAAARAVWRRHRGRLVLAGMVIALLFSVPLVNLMAPVVAAAFMLHVFEGMRRRSSREIIGG